MYIHLLYACFASCFLNFTIHVSRPASFFWTVLEYFITWRYSNLFHQPPVDEINSICFSTMTHNIITKILEHPSFCIGVSLAIRWCLRSGVSGSDRWLWHCDRYFRNRGWFSQRVTLDKPWRELSFAGGIQRSLNNHSWGCCRAGPSIKFCVALDNLSFVPTGRFYFCTKLLGWMILVEICMKFLHSHYLKFYLLGACWGN